jgi:hypothetical protein
VPKPTRRTSSPDFSAAVISIENTFDRLGGIVADRPLASATAPIRSFLFIMGTPRKTLKMSV